MNIFHRSILFVFFIFSVIIVTAQSYNSLPQSIIIEDRFFNNQNGWELTRNNIKHTSIYNGKYRCENKKDPVQYCTLPINFDTNRDFMIEGKVRYVSGNSGYGLVFGRANDKTSWRFIITDRDGQFFIRRLDSGVKNIVQSWSSAPSIKQSNSENTYAIVKQKQTLKFYANSTKIAEYPYHQFNGNHFGFFCGNNSTIEASYFKIAYLDKKQTSIHNNYENNYNNQKKKAAGPKIIIREPQLDRGFKTVKMKLIRVAGFATTPNGLLEVKVNGLQAYLGPDGYFSAEVPLVPGDNSINVIVTDTHQQSSKKTFSVKREY